MHNDKHHTTCHTEEYAKEERNEQDISFDKTRFIRWLKKIITPYSTWYSRDDRTSRYDTERERVKESGRDWDLFRGTKVSDVHHD